MGLQLPRVLWIDACERNQEKASCLTSQGEIKVRRVGLDQ